jgi:hypothetical protein
LYADLGVKTGEPQIYDQCSSPLVVLCILCNMADNCIHYSAASTVRGVEKLA